jgi:hypothetical protein
LNRALVFFSERRIIMKSVRMTLAAVGLLVAAGCASYYQVTDPQTKKVYYTSDLNQNGEGAVTFTDAHTGNKVTIQNSEVEKITEQQFDNGKSASEAAK